MALANIDIKWYHVHEYLYKHSNDVPTREEFIYYIKQITDRHAKQIEVLNSELEDFTKLKEILHKIR